ncbi:hypothetical protein HY495_03295, partial [Candidatus Woesearchaeota archaeon]|nr:hypothetical protein [Candidatus Woesearchaeota archaeon]
MKQWFIGVVLIALAFLIVAYGTTIPDDSLTGGAAADTACASLEGMAQDNCYADHLRCSKVDDKTIRDSCVADLAFKKEDSSVCN